MENAQIEKPLKKYRNESNYLNHPIIRTTRFPRRLAAYYRCFRTSTRQLHLFLNIY